MPLGLVPISQGSLHISLKVAAHVKLSLSAEQCHSPETLLSIGLWETEFDKVANDVVCVHRRTCKLPLGCRLFTAKAIWKKVQFPAALGPIKL